MTLRLDSFSIAIEYHLNVRRVIIAMQPSVSNTTTKVDVEAMVYLWSDSGTMALFLCNHFLCCWVSKIAVLIFVKVTYRTTSLTSHLVA